MSSELEAQLPQVPFTPHELEGIERVVWAYSQYLQRSPAAKQNARRIASLKQIRGRLAMQLAQLATGKSQEVQMFLNVEEIEELLTAMLEFTTLVKRIFPKNEERDSVVESINVWRLRLMVVSTPSGS